MGFAVVLLPLLSAMLVSCQDLRSTGELCAGRTTQISCNSNEVLFITSVLNTYSNDCNGFHVRNDNLGKCESKYMHNLNDVCTGKQSCNIKLQQFDNVIGLHKSTCTFKSNKANVFYVCVPKMYNAYDKIITMCGSPAVISSNDIKTAFIRSPGYPDYYGNNRACTLQIKLEANTRINMYLLDMNMEGLGIFSRVPKDFLKITTDSSDQQLYGSSSNRIIHNTTETVNLKFQSDFITTSSLNRPKGFLLYIQTSSTLKPTQPPTTTPLTTTAPTTTIDEVFDVNYDFYSTIGVADLGMRNNIEVTTEETKAESDDSIGSNGAFSHEKYSNPKINNQEGKKSIYFICILVALAGLIVIVVTSILLIIRRRQRQEESDYNYGDGKVYGNITDSTPKKVEILNETIVDDKKSELFDKQENIYSPCPIGIETTHVVKSCDTEAPTTAAAPEVKREFSTKSEEIYECISEFDPSSSSSVASDETSLSKIYDSTDVIYSTPTNKEVTNDDLKALREQERNRSVLDATLDTSTTQLLKNNDQKC